MLQVVCYEISSGIWVLINSQLVSGSSSRPLVLSIEGCSVILLLKRRTDSGSTVDEKLFTAENQQRILNSCSPLLSLLCCVFKLLFFFFLPLITVFIYLITTHAVGILHYLSVLSFSVLPVQCSKQLWTAARLWGEKNVTEPLCSNICCLKYSMSNNWVLMLKEEKPEHLSPWRCHTRWEMRGHLSFYFYLFTYFFWVWCPGSGLFGLSLFASIHLVS